MVRWFYRSEDALEKHPPFFGNDELIWSNHRDTVSIDNILGKCNVHTLDEYVKLQTVTYEVTIGDIGTCLPGKGIALVGCRITQIISSCGVRHASSGTMLSARE
ncbi:hypothetical protein ACFX13_006325 [Malus domestica]